MTRARLLLALAWTLALAGYGGGLLGFVNAVKNDQPTPPPVRLCTYCGNDTGGQPCPRKALQGWTTCARHYSAGRAVKR